MHGLKDTSSQTYRQLMGNGLRYDIPKFQRDYSWETEQWDDLWQDLMSVHREEEPAHYLGYLVLQTNDNKHYNVIDGQQRLTTISLLILASLRVLTDMVARGADAYDNERRVEALRSSYIGVLDPVTLIASNKMRLNRNNELFYRTKLTQLAEMPKKGLNASEKLMRNCYQWYVERLSEQFETGASLASFIDGIVDRLFFTRITVTDNLNAFKVFETLNARGVQLSSSDLLKNYLFSIVDLGGGAHSTEIDEVETLWAAVVEKLGAERLPDFIRVYWNSRHRSVSKNNLFKAIRQTVTTKSEVFSLIREMERLSDIYTALKDPNDELWSTDKKLRSLLYELKLYQVRQPLPLLLVAYDKMSPEKFAKVLRACVVVSFRYNVIMKRNPNAQDDIYNSLSILIAEGGKFEPSRLSPVYPSDQEFSMAFENRQFEPTTKNTKLERYILSRLDACAGGPEVDVLGDAYTLEHILPQKINQHWAHISEAVHGRCVNRLGNHALLEKDLNSSIGSAGFDEKTTLYSRSKLALTASLANDHSTWDENEIISRQGRLAKLAVKAWRLEFA